MARWPFRPAPPPGAARGDDEAGIREELELYLEMRTQELVEGGMSPADARREAERRFGDPEEVARRVRQARKNGHGNGRWGMGGWMHDVAYAARTFRRSPGFTLMAGLTLAVALAGNTAIFSVLDAAVLRSLPFPDAGRLVQINGVHVREGETAVRYASVPEFRDWRERARTVGAMAAVSPRSVTLAGDGQAQRFTAEFVSEGYFALLGGRTSLGRVFSAEEYAVPDGHPVVVLSRDMWQNQFGGDPEIVGRTLQVNERLVTVVGVMAGDFAGLTLDADLWSPLSMISLVASPRLLESRGSRFLPVVGRLAPGATAEDAQGELDAIARDLQADFPDTHEDRFAQVVSLREAYLGTTGRLLWVLFGAGALLLFIAAANVANLLLVRAHARSRELVVRRAVGASGGRIARQLLLESLTLAALGGGAGLLLAAWGLGALTPLIPDGMLPAYATPALSTRVFAFTLGVLVLVGVGAGTAPALASAGKDLASALRSGGRGTTARGVRTQRVFVVTQVGLALLLLVGAGLLTRSFQAQLAVDPGMEMDGVHAFRLQPPRERYPDGQAMRAYTSEIRRALEGVPGVEGVALSSDFPFRGNSSGSFVVRPDDLETLIRYHRHSVTPGYFRTVGVQLREGRFLEPSDDETAPVVVVVTESFVRRVFPDAASGLGLTVLIAGPDNPESIAEIVGIVEDIRYRDLTQDMMAEANSPDVFFAMAQVPSLSLEVTYRVTGDPVQVGAAVRRAVQGVDPATPIFGMASLEELYRAQTATPRFAAFLMGLFSALALLLACVGIYGVLSFTVGQRGPEIALRRALGAQAGDVARSVVWDGARLAAVGLVVGGGVALLGGRLLESLLFNVTTRDPATFAVVAATMMAVATAAAAIPAWRAARKSPADALDGG